MAAMNTTLVEDSVTKFQHLSLKLTTLLHGRREGDRQYINALFDELNALDFQTPILTNSDKAVLIINQCCSVVPPNDTFLVAKGCQLMNNLMTKQQVRVEGKTLSMAINWCVQSLKYCADIAILDILATLEVLLRGHGKCVEEIHELVGINGVLTSLLDPVETGVDQDKLKLASLYEVQLLALKCFESITFLPEEAKSNSSAEGLNGPLLDTCVKIFLKHLTTNRDDGHKDLDYYKMHFTSLRGLQNILQQSPSLIDQLLGDTLGVVKAYMLYGLPGHTGVQAECVFPIPLSQNDVKPTMGPSGRGGKGIRVRKHRSSQHHKRPDTNRKEISEGECREEHAGLPFANSYKPYTPTDFQDIPVWIKTSDSDFSDTEAGQTANFRVTYARIRQAALALLLTIIKITEKKVFFGYWSSLLPDGLNSAHTRTLITCLTKDPSPRGRMEAVNVLAHLLSGSRMYLSQAENSERSSAAFTPFSITLGNMMRELHRSLCLAVMAENSAPVITQLLKCIAIMIQNTTYHRLAPGLITKLIASVKPFTKHKDWSVQVASLTVLGSIVAVEPPLPEVLGILIRPSLAKRTEAPNTRNISTVSEMSSKTQIEQDLNSEYGDDEEEVCVSDAVKMVNEYGVQTSWLLDICLEKLGMGVRREVQGAGYSLVVPVPVRVEALQVCTVLARNYFVLVLAGHLNSLMQALDLALSDTDVTICLHSGRTIEAIGNAMQQNLQQGGGKAVLLADAVEFWRTMLSGPLIALIQNPDEACLRSVGCDCLANIGAQAFELLAHDRQILIITLLFGCRDDGEQSVRSSAVRALAICVLFPTLREDIHFVTDTSESVIKALEDETLNVRVKASWSLGNLSDALVLNMNNKEIESIPPQLLLELLESSVKSARDNDKLRSNAVRAIGNLLRLLTEELLLKSNFRESAEKAIATLVHSATSGSNMKVRWNACYAIGNMMKNSALYSESMSWQSVVFSALMGLVQNFRNFKVRISAALALSAPSTRQHYGCYYMPVWIAVLNGLDNSHNMEDFSEYKHRDNLVDQICLTLSHLGTLVNKEDLRGLQDILVFHLEALQQNMLRFHEHTVPEKADLLLAAANHASTLLQLPGLSTDQHGAAALLASVFVQDDDMPFPVHCTR